MERLNHWIAEAASFVWGLPLLILLIGGGLYLLVYSRFLPFKYFGHAIKVLRGKYDNPDDPGEINHFQALMTALSSTVGMGNIAGVAVAIAVGGPGAVFWMWVSAIVGMSTKFFTCTLAILYRGKDDSGAIQGGPMYFITEGLGKAWKPLAAFFSIAGLVGALPVFNVNQLTQAINDILLVPNGIAKDFSTDLTIGIVLAIIAGIVILGGLNRISKTAAKIVPGMVVLYFLAVLVILFINASEVPRYFQLIFTDAFAANNYTGDPMLGGILGALIILGIRRGAFSNEAGIGTAPMAHGAAKTEEPIREGLVAMLGPFIDTIIVCTLTALSILVTGVWQSSDANGVSLTAKAFSDAMPGFGSYVLLLCIAVFSISSLFSYSYYGTKCLSFLVGTRYKHTYNYFYIGSILIGATTSLSLMINLIDTFFALMAIPTMLATLILAPKVMAKARVYFKGIKNL
ncbi:alanine/glycine:cation symporter family protein [Leeuwenhoekiella marinoflava]|uniref:AGCS family alanine or glycine:cation symporter n=2 Tax=Leeuwenhoekiella marinoflava TaxID=988 RepID=A0A4Q0PQP0_9FLAO|nr:alanine/glycine:cation symporter family protein [Leeuwenhoekiella marinoflava]RXG32891.1 AGCS family alanine or glycine:cation symporter [Leeuwenhoekiella marinoflava]SHE60545.1 alanine or glycine:cation symporter, AGCS family [Leeuwenhoekiella marinoflava DSM 3653]